MIPFTYKSSYVTANGNTAAVVYQITDIIGLTRWVDYIPVKFLASPTEFNIYNNDAAQLVDNLLDVTGKQAGLDYIKVYEDSSATVPWAVEANGYIPCFKVSDFTQDNLSTEDGFNLLQESGYLILLES